MKILCVGPVADKNTGALFLKAQLEGVAAMKQHKDWPTKYEYDAKTPERALADGFSDYRLVVVGEDALHAQDAQFVKSLRAQAPELPVIGLSSKFSDRFLPKDEGLAALGVECAHSGQGLFELFHRIHKKLGTRPEQGAAPGVA